MVSEHSGTALVKQVFTGRVVGTLYLTVYGHWGDDLVCIAIADDGTVLNQWTCSNTGWMRHDLHDRHFDRESGKPVNDHGALIAGHFGGMAGDAYDIVDLGDDSPPADVLARNREQGERG